MADKATYRIQQEVWSVPIEAARRLLKHLKAEGRVNAGSYWQSNFATPTRRAIRAKQGYVEIWTGGFTTGEFANLLALVDCDSELYVEE